MNKVLTCVGNGEQCHGSQPAGPRWVGLRQLSLTKESCSCSSCCSAPPPCRPILTSELLHHFHHSSKPSLIYTVIPSQLMFEGRILFRHPLLIGLHALKKVCHRKLFSLALLTYVPAISIPPHLLKDEVLVKRQSLVYLINLFNISYFFINSLVVYLFVCLLFYSGCYSKMWFYRLTEILSRFLLLCFSVGRIFNQIHACYKSLSLAMCQWSINDMQQIIKCPPRCHRLTS